MIVWTSLLGNFSKCLSSCFSKISESFICSSYIFILVPSIKSYQQVWKDVPHIIHSSMITFLHSQQLNQCQCEEKEGNRSQCDEILPQIPRRRIIHLVIIENRFAFNWTDLRLIRRTQFQIRKFIDRNDVWCIAEEANPFNPGKKWNNICYVNKISREYEHHHTKWRCH